MTAESNAGPAGGRSARRLGGGLARRLDRRWTAALFAAGAALALFALRAPVRSTVGWDDTFYTLQASSLVEDGDLDLRNDVLASGLDNPHRLEILTATTPAGALDNEFSIGPALVWLPAYGAGMPLRALTHRPPGTVPVRWSLAQRDALHLLSLLAFMGVVCFLLRLDALASASDVPTERGLLAAADVPQPRGLLATAALVLGTPLLVYATSDYTMSHLPSALATALLVAAALALERDPRPRTALAAGVALGLVFLVRWQDLAFGLLLLAPLVGVARRRGAPRAAGGGGDGGAGLPRALALAGCAGGGFLAMASLQLHAWALERGRWLTLPQGQGFFHPWAPEPAGFLFSGRAGLLTWSPVFALAAAGLVLPWRCRLPRRWAFAALAVLAIEIWANAAVSDWWGGHSFGARRMVSCVPLLPLGLANLRALAARRGPSARRLLAALLLAACGWGLFVGLLYWNGVQDLSLVFRGRPAEAAATMPGDAINDPAAARARAGRLALAPPADYWAAAGEAGSAPGILATWLLLGAAALAAAAVLARVPPRRLTAALLALYLALALGAHLRLARGPHPDWAERAGWRRLSRQWRLPPRQYDRDEVVVPAVSGADGTAGWRRSPADAYRYVESFLEWRAGDPAVARALLAALGARGYPAAEATVADLAAIERGGRLLRWMPGSFFAPAGWRPALEVPLPATVAREWRLAIDLTPGELAGSEVASGDLYDVCRLLDAAGQPLATVALRSGGGLVLEAAGQRAERPIRLAGGSTYALTLRYALSPAAVEVTLAGPRDAGAEPVRLAFAPPPSAVAPAAVVLGRSRAHPLGGALLRGAVFADLRVTAIGAPSPLPSP